MRPSRPEGSEPGPRCGGPADARSESVQAIVFDFDLTLADSTAGVIDCANHALALIGFAPCEPERICRTIGLTLPLAFASLASSDDPDLAAEFSRHFLSRADEVMALRTEIYPEVPDTLAALRSGGAGLAIVSTKRRRTIEAIFDRLGLTGVVDVIVGGEDVRRHKPDPEGLLAALARLATDPAGAIYVGDHPVDAETAARAGVRFIGVRSRYGQPGGWRTAAPPEMIDSVGALPGLASLRRRAVCVAE